MKITIIGATGRVGRLALDEAVTAGHDVTAVARDIAALPPSVRAIAANLASTDRSTLESALAGSNAVLSCLGPTSKGEIGIATTGTIAIIEAMRAVGTHRLVVISASPVATLATAIRPTPAPDPGEDFITRTVAMPLMKRIFSKQYEDLAAMEDAIRASGLEWTIMRPPRLTNKSGRNYRVAIAHNVPGGNSISRRALAKAMLHVLTDPATIASAVGVAE